jgi:hypothetical protein
MGERPDQIERHIQHQREELGDNFSELEEKVKSAFDWRTQFEERPAVMLGIALVGGALIGALIPSIGSSSSGTSDYRPGKNKYSGDRWSPYTNRETASSNVSDTPSTGGYSGSTGGGYPAYSGYSNTPGQASETWNNLKNAAIGMATARLSEFIEDLVPGFTDHYQKAASGKPTTPFSSMPTPHHDDWQKPNGGTDYASHS